jgi:hypothetical protein
MYDPRMTRASSVLSLLLAGLVAGCAPPVPSPGEPAPAPPSVTGCQPEPAQFALGQFATASLVQEAQRRAGAARVRVLRPGQAVTMEFDGTRLNLDVDAGNRVLRARCG